MLKLILIKCKCKMAPRKQKKTVKYEKSTPIAENSLSAFLHIKAIIFIIKVFKIKFKPLVDEFLMSNVNENYLKLFNHDFSTNSISYNDYNEKLNTLYLILQQYGLTLQSFALFVRVGYGKYINDIIKTIVTSKDMFDEEEKKMFDVNLWCYYESITKQKLCACFDRKKAFNQMKKIHNEAIKNS